MLGGPLAGTAVTALEGAFGLQAGAGPEAITQAVQSGAMTPEVVAAMRAADQKHAEAMAQQGIDLEKLNLAHRTPSSHRLQRSEQRQATGNGSKGLDTAGTCSRNHDRVLRVVGSDAISVISYYFGSSAGQARQTELLAQAPAIGR